MINNPYTPDGTFTLYCGPMFSGKSQYLIIEAQKLKLIKNYNFLFVKPIIDQGVSTKIKTRTGLTEECKLINNSSDILQILEEEKIIPNAVLIDEISFFDKGIVDVVENLLKKNAKVYASGLDLDFRGEPFETMQYLLSIADHVNKLGAVCMHKNCYGHATRTQRLIDGEPAHYDSKTVIIADENAKKELVTYEPRCRKHHEVPGKPSSIENILKK
jgi:thymidine kinase